VLFCSSANMSSMCVCRPSTSTSWRSNHHRTSAPLIMQRLSKMLLLCVVLIRRPSTSTSWRANHHTASAPLLMSHLSKMQLLCVVLICRPSTSTSWRANHHTASATSHHAAATNHPCDAAATGPQHYCFPAKPTTCRWDAEPARIAVYSELTVLLGCALCCAVSRTRTVCKAWICYAVMHCNGINGRYSAPAKWLQECCDEQHAPAVVLCVTAMKRNTVCMVCERPGCMSRCRLQC
jgi:hypothetical protein